MSFMQCSKESYGKYNFAHWHHDFQSVIATAMAINIIPALRPVPAPEEVVSSTAMSVIITVIFWNKMTFSVEIGVLDICTKSGSIFAAGIDSKYSK